jgi:hypothetical protein
LLGKNIPHNTVGFLSFLLAILSVHTQIQLSKSSLSEKKNPYFLFASSNFGVFAVLLTNPFLFEPNFEIITQLYHREVLYAVMVLLFLMLQWKCPPEKMRDWLKTSFQSLMESKLGNVYY